MEWFYEKEGKQNGPVEASELLRMLDADELSSKSLVWRVGMEEWKPMAEVDVLKGGSLKGESDEETAVCSHSGEVKPKSEMMPYGDRWVSSEHREEFVQGLMERSSLEGGGEVTDYEVRIGQYLGRAWKMLADDFWPPVGASALILICHMGASQVPLLGMLVGLISIPLFTGLLYYMLRKVRGQTVHLEDAFSGFKRNFLQLFLVGLIQIVIVGACMIPGGLVLIGGVFAMDGVSEIVGISIIVAGVILIILPAIYLSTAWIFAGILCIDREMDFWPAMSMSMKTVNKHWFGCFLFYLVTSAIYVGGLLAFCLGIFFAFPWVMLAMAFFYEDVFGRQGVNDLESKAE